MKKLLIKFLPDFFIQIVIKNKYKKNNIKIHKDNIKNNKTVEIKCKNQEKYNLLKSMLKKSFGGVLNIDKYSFYFHPVAIIKVPNDIESYLKHIGAKSRNMNKKAEKNGVSCKTFDWNKKVDDVFEIHNSSLRRQGREMDKSYKDYPKKVDYLDKEDFSIIYVGSFLEDKLVGYVELYIYGNFAMTNRILGHKEYLKFGIMNLMIKECVEYTIEYKIEYINYLTMQNRENNSLSAFKKRIGFREYSLLELK